MADDEQFSLCWNNFNSNLSAGFHESLCRGDLVDVTLAAEGQLVKAHRLVLSVCSPYFRKMFTQMPANQHAFVFLKDVSHTALKDLIQFMYCGEVNVKQEALPAFISTAEALQIKGLTDSDPAPSSSPAEPSTPTPQIQQITSPRVRQQRTSQTRSYKIETIDDSDEKPATQIVIQTTAAPQATIAQQQASHLQQHTHHHSSAQQISSVPATATVVTHKRPAQRSIGSAPHIKRTKSTIDPLDASESATSQITVQATVVDSKAQQSDTEYIDMPMEIPTKSEPDYSEDAGEVNATDHEATYVEDDSYGDMRYDESYFTENEDGTANASVATSVTGGNSGGVNVSNASVATTSTKALIKQQTSFSDSSYVDAADQSNNDAQAKQNVRETKNKPGTIPLHTGSRVFVSKANLGKIFIDDACIYTSRLSELVFGLKVLEAAARRSPEKQVSFLDEHALKSVITHVVQIFLKRGKNIDGKMVLNFIKHKLRTMALY
ncbi:modifier of mdg4 isoform X9 [Teleopsis dalmanni]|uniref:modifier of mdg4 isoform X9 n=2 Tax=Teleopsis dalmanni TaxID=139649 RepID=UPI0018CCA013|nr:modifier of mdg4 isoform X9 [Teleopsis dalmanni]